MGISTYQIRTLNILAHKEVEYMHARMEIGSIGMGMGMDLITEWEWILLRNGNGS